MRHAALLLALLLAACSPAAVEGGRNAMLSDGFGPGGTPTRPLYLAR